MGVGAKNIETGRTKYFCEANEFAGQRRRTRKQHLFGRKLIFEKKMLCPSLTDLDGEFVSEQRIWRMEENIIMFSGRAYD
jgi:hypothetical protein